MSIINDLNDAEKAMAIAWENQGIPNKISVALIQAVRNRDFFEKDKPRGFKIVE